MYWRKPHSFLSLFRGRQSETAQTTPAEPPEPGPSIFKLPMEFLLQIFPYIDLPSQVCFAMSSKGLYKPFGSVSQAGDLRFPLLSSSKHGKYNQTRGYQLLLGVLCWVPKAAST